MASATQRKQAIEKVIAEAGKQAIKEIDEEVLERDDGKLFMKNSAGEMLMCKLTIAQRPGSPDPLCVTINEEFRWIKRGKEVIVPWYVVRFMLDNIETKFRQEKDEQGKRITITERMPSEPISYVMIDPAPGCVM